MMACSIILCNVPCDITFRVFALAGCDRLGIIPVDKELNEHWDSELQVDVKREVTLMREIRAADPQSAAHQELPSSPLRPLGSTCYHRGVSPSDPYAAAAWPAGPSPRELILRCLLMENCQFRDRLNHQMYSLQNLTESVKFLQRVCCTLNPPVHSPIPPEGIAASLNVGRTNDEGSSSNTGRGCSYKTFIAGKPKEFYGTEGTVGLLGWSENIDSKLNITKCADGSKVEDGGASKESESRKKRKDDQHRNMGSFQPDRRRRITQNYGVATQKSRGYACSHPKCTCCNLQHTRNCPSKEEHEQHLDSILRLLKEKTLYAKFSKCEFGCENMDRGLPAHLPTQARSGDREDPTEVRNSDCSENKIIRG
nr:hypothetical protein [Tanacetum cinerariifolium]